MQKCVIRLCRRTNKQTYPIGHNSGKSNLHSIDMKHLTFNLEYWDFLLFFMLKKTRKLFKMWRKHFHFMTYFVTNRNKMEVLTFISLCG